MSVLLDSGSGKSEETIVELVDEKINKYEKKSINLFKFTELTGLQNVTNKQEELTINLEAFLMNKDLSPFQNKTVTVKRSSVVFLEVTRDVTRTYKEKYIPISTRFVCSFPSGDLSKAKIIKGNWNEFSLGANGTSTDSGENTTT